MWTGGSSGHSDAADKLPLPDRIALMDDKRRRVEECRIQARAVIDDQQVTLQREGFLRREDHHAISRGKDGRARAASDVCARMVSTRLSTIDALRPEVTGNAARSRPDHRLTPSLCTGIERARGPDQCQFSLPSPQEFRIGDTRRAQCDIDLLDRPLSWCDDNGLHDSFGWH